MAEQNVIYARAGRRVLYYIAFSIVAGLVLLSALGPTIAMGYVVLAVLGFVLLLRDLRADMRARFREGAVEGYLDRLHEAAEKADRIRAEPWHADAVVDMREVQERAWREAGLLANALLLTPNPYFVLPLEGLVKWGFASPNEIRAAVEAAQASGVPDPFYPEAFNRLRFLGWSEFETRARYILSRSKAARERER